MPNVNFLTSYKVSDSNFTNTLQNTNFVISLVQNNGSESNNGIKVPSLEELNSFVKFSFAKKTFDYSTNKFNIVDLGTSKCKNAF